jgi:PRTRC genetic system protein B
MNNIIQQDFKPLQAIIVYQQNLSGHNGDNYYLETRRIHKNKMMEGTPMTKSALSKIVEEINTKEIERIHCDGILPSNLLYWGKKNLNVELVWYVKSSWKSLSFSKHLGIKDGKIIAPTLVFKLSGNTLSVFAVKTKTPKENTILYKAPFHNVNEVGQICMGTAKVVKSSEIKTIMKSYEDGFFQSKFTEIHGGGTPIKANLNIILNECVKMGAAVPHSLFRRQGKLVKDLV